jgi:hypothetical protein
LDLEDSQQSCPGHRVEDTLEVEGPVGVGEGPKEPGLMEGLVVSLLLCRGPSLGLGSQTALFDLSEGVVSSGPFHQFGFLVRVDPGGVRDQLGPGDRKLSFAEGLVHRGLVGKGLSEPEETSGFSP